MAWEREEVELDTVDYLVRLQMPTLRTVLSWVAVVMGTSVSPETTVTPDLGSSRIYRFLSANMAHFYHP
jgi:hypothetical protein